MPRRTYMVVHARRDHSLRVPRPDLSAKLGAPNACNGCHAGRSTRWAAGTVARWYGPDRQRQGHWGEAIQAGRNGDPGAGESLLRVAVDAQTPGIARATALSLLRRYPGAVTDADLAGALTDADPLVRAAAATAAEALEPDRRAGLLAAALADPVRGVRVEAARVLMAGPPDAATVPGLLPALAEYRAVQEVNADRAEARLNLGWLEARLGRLANAEAAFRGALQLDRTFAPAWVNLAEIYRLQGRDPEGEVLLRQALARAPGDATIHYALGLLLVRRRRLGEATAELARAATLAPREARFAYAYRSISPDPRH
jgi:tetratricopeptide (TPR) repeat protein